jgi:hypothetical protein
MGVRVIVRSATFFSSLLLSICGGGVMQDDKKAIADKNIKALVILDFMAISKSFIKHTFVERISP